MANYLIAGLRNPGKKYEYTRHNVGEMLIRHYLEGKPYAFKNSPFQGEIAQVQMADNKVVFLLPSTYMNLSGFAVKKCVDYYKLPIEHLLVVCDDVEIPFGEIRIREKGSCGGHNGLRHIQEQLGTTEYARLRLGVGKNHEGDLADYVLSRFTDQELHEMPDFLNRGSKIMQQWMEKGLLAASQLSGELNKSYQSKGDTNDTNCSTSL